MKSFVVKETVLHYHKVEIDDELNIEEVVASARNRQFSDETGYEALNRLLEKFKDRYDFEYSVEPNYCGTETKYMEVIGCDEDSPELD